MDLVRQELRLEPFYWKLPEQFEGKKVRTRMLKSHESKIKHVFRIMLFGDLSNSSFLILFCQLMAYGGKLRYTIYFEAREETGFSTYNPQVIIRGGTPAHARIIIRHMAAPLIGQLTRHEIEMTEVRWLSVGCHVANGFALSFFTVVSFLVNRKNGNIMVMILESAELWPVKTSWMYYMISIIFLSRLHMEISWDKAGKL